MQINTTTRNLNADGDVGKKLNPKKAVCVDGIPGTAVRVLIDERAEVLNVVNAEGKIPAKWKEARVVLIPKRGRDPALTSSFQPISVLPALSKVWKHTFKGLSRKAWG